MPLPTHRLNLLLVPADPERVPDHAALAALFSALQARGVLNADHRAGTAAEALLPGGFALMRADIPPSPVLYGNRQGGFSAACPGCGAPVVAQLGAALGAWRAGQGRALTCPRCGRASDIAALRYAPDAAPARFAIELRDVVCPDLEPEADILSLLIGALGDAFHVIPSRGP